jgi:hypothetical protein
LLNNEKGPLIPSGPGFLLCLDLRYTEGLPMPLETVHIQAQHGHAQARSQAANTCEMREEPHWIASFTEYSVYRQPISAQQ